MSQGWSDMRVTIDTGERSGMRWYAPKAHAGARERFRRLAQFGKIMNIFVLDLDPVQAARWHMDKHVVKMPLEAAQMLSTVARAQASIEESAGGLTMEGVEQRRIDWRLHQIYRSTHKNHPCVRWAMQSALNWWWLVQHAFALCDEYTRRYGKVHASREIVQLCFDHAPRPTGKVSRTPFALAMGEASHVFRREDVPDVAVGRMASVLPDPVLSYRRYYRTKGSFASWKAPAEPPPWWGEPDLPEGTFDREVARLGWDQGVHIVNTTPAAEIVLTRPR